MFFWFKKKTVVLDCFTYLNYCHELFPIVRAPKVLPEWFKNLEKHNFTDPTKKVPMFNMRSCVGFIDYFTNSIAVPLWDFLHIRIDNNNAKFLCESVQITNHEREQYQGLFDESYQHFKIEVPWVIKSNSKTKFIQTFPIWCQNPNSRIERLIHCPGVLDFHYQHSTNFNGFIKKTEKEGEIQILSFQPNTPLMFFTPLDDVNIKINTHLLPTPEFLKISRWFPPTAGPYRFLTYKKIRMQKEREKKCPFGFGKNK